MLHIAMATHSLKSTLTLISQSISTKYCIFVCYTKRNHCAKFEQNPTRNKDIAKMGHDVIMTSFFKIAPQFFVFEYFSLIPIDVTSFKLIEGQIKELQGVVPNTPSRDENDQKKQGRIWLKNLFGLNLCFL